MMATLPELVLKREQSLLEALGTDMVASTRDEAEDLLLLAVQGRELFRRFWTRTQDKLRAGMSDADAQELLELMTKLANVETRIITLFLQATSQQADAIGRAEAVHALLQAQEIEAEARKLLAQARSLPRGDDQLPARFDADRARRSLEQF